MSDARRLTVSVVVVTKDRPERLARLLNSLAAQTLAPDEVIVIDNNSARSYADVFRRYADNLPLRTFVERQPGIPAARNRGIQEARCDLVLFTDDDCEVEVRWVEAIVKPFYRNPHIGAVGGEVLSIESEGTLVEEFCVRESLMRVGRSEENYEPMEEGYET